MSSLSKWEKDTGREASKQFNLQQPTIYSGTKSIFLANFLYSWINTINAENKINLKCLNYV